MKRRRMLLLGAAGVATAVSVIVVSLGIELAPRFPSLYEDGPAVPGTVAYVAEGRNECLVVLDVATGEERVVTCSPWLYLEGWNQDGNVVIHSEDSRDRAAVMDPVTGAVVLRGAPFAGVPPGEPPAPLWTTSGDGHATLTFHEGGSDTVLIDVDGPRNYAFWSTGLTPDGRYAWAVDSEDRLLVAPVDGTGGPWVVAEGVRDVAWK
jgi:hypothetical protein